MILFLEAFCGRVLLEYGVSGSLQRLSSLCITKARVVSTFWAQSQACSKSRLDSTPGIFLVSHLVCDVHRQKLQVWL